MKCFALNFAILGLLAAPAVAQTAAGGGGGGGRGVASFSGSMTVSPSFGSGRVVTGAPYSADETVEHTQTLADGTHITQTPQTSHVYRDSQGRTRTERPMFHGPNAPTGLTIVEIRDPVSGYAYMLDPENRSAHRFKIAQFVGGSGPNVVRSEVVASAPPGPRPARAVPESLGTEMIEGVLARGSRMTTTYPIDSVGNDRPISQVMETWMSIDLSIAVLTKNTDPRSGENITKLTNINRAEPDPTLFQPPQDYAIQDEKGPITLTVKRP